MTTLSFLITLFIFILLVIAYIAYRKYSSNKHNMPNIDILATLVLLLYAAFGLLLFPSMGVSPQKTKEIPIISTEYEKWTTNSGLLIIYNNKYTFITDYRTINEFNDSTKLIYRIENSFYGKVPAEYIIINNEKLKLKALK